MNVAKKIREYKIANPTASVEEIAKACETSTGYVYQVMYKMKHKKVKAAKKAKPVATQPTEGQKVVRSEITRLHKDIDDWRSLYLSSFDEIEQLKQDVIGYRAVISYLQGQLDGLAV
jgi:hypothetical protein